MTLQRGGRRTSTDWFFRFCATWTFAQMFLTVWDFLDLTPTMVIPERMPIANLLLLATYVLRKEAERWIARVRAKRKGEFLFWGWWVLTLLLFVIASVTNERYTVPNRLLENLVYVTAVFVGGTFSKAAYWVHVRRRKTRKS